MNAQRNHDLKDDSEKRGSVSPVNRRIAALLVATAMVMSAATVIFVSTDGNLGDSSALPSSEAETSAETAVIPATVSGAPDVNSILNALTENDVPSKYAFLPNVAAVNPGSTVSPFYATSPAPMGVADYGLMSPSGTSVAYKYDTKGFNGSAMFEGLDPFYLMNNDPFTVSVQLNAVLNHTTVQGNNDYVYWIHSVALYTPAEGSMQLVNNIWNLSSSSFDFPDNTILEGNGATVPGLFYYSAGPVLTVPTTFTLELSIESGIIDNNNAVYFNYSITNTESSSTVSGIYDTAVFNSTVQGSDEPTEQAMFHVDGFMTTPSGLLYDVEFVIGGPGGGSTSTIYSANNQMKLYYYDEAGSKYATVAAAYNYGSNTAETVSGLSVWWTSQKNPIAHLSSGPSLLAKLWGSSQTRSGATNIIGKIDPGNAFLFMNIGSAYNANGAAWAPILSNGTYKFALPGGLDYSGTILLSDFAPYTFDASAYAGNETEESGPPGDNTTEVTTHFNVTLDVDISKGVYTPLYATGNDQLASLTVGSSTSGNITGAGTLNDPYMVENNQLANLNALFTHTNAFMFPEFSGILIRNTDAYTMIADPPSFGIHYPASMSNYFSYFGVPPDNSLNIQFYKTSGITLYGGQSVTGWFAPVMNMFPAANVIFWDSTDFLIAGNDFSGMGSSLLIYNGENTLGGGTVWGNHFLPSDITSSPYADTIMSGNNPAGLSVYSSGNLIYNNYFDIARPSYSPAYDLHTGSTAATYVNSWNLSSKMPLTYTSTVHGLDLYGSIIDCNYQGGNYWYSFDGAIPYNDSSNIAFGGDYYPLILPTYAVVFNNLGLPSDYSWTVTFHGKAVTSNSTSVTFYAPNGTHAYSVQKPSVYSVTPNSGTVFVYGEGVTVDLTFTLIAYEITFTQSGLPDGSTWSVTLDGISNSSTASTISFMKENGTYAYSVSGPQYYSIHPETGSLLVYGGNMSQEIVFVYIQYAVTFEATGLPSGQNWTVQLDGSEYTSGSGIITVMMLNGTYSYTITAPENYSATPSSGEVIVNGEGTTLGIEISLNTYAVTFMSDGLPAGTQWEVTFNGQSANSTGLSIAFEVPNGNYDFNVTSVSDYSSNITSGSVAVNGSDETVTIHFTQNTNLGLVVGLIAGGAGAAIAAGVLIAHHYSRRPKQ